MKTYKVDTITTGCWSGTLDPKKLEAIINQYAAEGWKFVRSIHETRRQWLILVREAHFLIFEKDAVQNVSET